MPGINNYLKEEFKKKVDENSLAKHFKCIKPLTFIDFNFLIEFVDKAGEFRMNEIIDVYHNAIQKRNKKFLRFIELNDMFSVNDNFETVFYQLNPKLFEKRTRYVTSIINALNLTEGLKGSLVPQAH